MRLKIEGGARLRGVVSVPADKSITHRALMLAALGDRPVRIDARSPGADNFSTAGAMAALGARVQSFDGGWEVEGAGPRGLCTPLRPVDCGNSGTTIRLLAGLLAGAGVAAQLAGDASLSRRPMGRICKPLRALGAQVAGRMEEEEEGGGRELPPLRIERGAFRGGRWELDIASAQVKTALLFAGLTSGRAVSLREPALSRDHSERMLAAMGVALERHRDGDAHDVHLAAGARLVAPRRIEVPGDFSSAAFFIAAGLLVPDSALTVRDVCVNPTRIGLLQPLSAFGVTTVRALAERERGGEPIADLQIEYASSSSSSSSEDKKEEVVVGGALVPTLIDELVVLAAIGCRQPQPLRIRDAAELRVKESDRIDETVRLLAAFGVTAAATVDGLLLPGRVRGDLRAARLDVSSDHRVALTAAVLALAAPGESELDGFEIADVSFPGFVDALAALGAKVRRMA